MISRLIKGCHPMLMLVRGVSIAESAHAHAIVSSLAAYAVQGSQGQRLVGRWW